MSDDKMVILSLDWVLNAIVRQYESETGLTVASVGLELGHILGPDFETAEYQAAKFVTELKGAVIEIDNSE